MTMQKIKKILIPLYILFLIGSFFYVRSVVKEKSVDVDQKEEEKVVEVKPVTVFLKYDGITQKMKMKNVETVLDLLETLRDDGKIIFEKTLYTYGIELDHFNRVVAPEGYHWRVFYKDQDITDSMGNVNLEDNSTYEVKLVEKAK